MGARSLDAEIAQVPSRDRADRYFAPNKYTIKIGIQFSQQSLQLCDILVNLNLLTHLKSTILKKWLYCISVDCVICSPL